MQVGEIKERPILMSASMVIASMREINPKSQTRRIMKVPHKNDEARIVMEVPIEGSDHAHYRPQANYWELWGPSDPDGRGLLYEWGFSCPYGKVGDRLWVREAFMAYGYWTRRWNDKKVREEWCFVDETLNESLDYRFDFEGATGRFRAMGFAWHKRNSLFMPRAASRTTLEITDVRVERLQDISEEDAIAEGIEAHEIQVAPGNFTYRNYSNDEWCVSPILSYKTLWESINGVGSWAANPWIWAISFRKNIECA